MAINQGTGEQALRPQQYPRTVNLRIPPGPREGKIDSSTGLLKLPPQNRQRHRSCRQTMPFVLSQAEERDSEAIVRLQFGACALDPGFSVIFPKGATPESVAFFTRISQHEIRNDTTCDTVKATDADTGELASFATWYLMPEKSVEQVDEEMLNDQVDLPADANQDAGKVLIRDGHRKRHEIMGSRAYMYLAAVGTATKYRRQGAASLCLEWGTRLADERGLPGYVEGTPLGTELYRKFGFEIVDKLKLAVSPWKEGDYWNVLMYRATSLNLL